MDNATPPPDNSHVAQLRKTALELEDVFYTSGSVPLGDRRIELRGAFGSLSLPKSLDDVKLELRALMAKMHPAPFGHGRETLVDRNVRAALAMRADEFEARGVMEALVAAHVLEQVRDALAPTAGSVEARLDKLNVYCAPDGHFQVHRDTPHDANHIGTLVVCLPLRFLGGALLLRHQRVQRVFDWGPAMAASQWPQRAAGHDLSDADLRALLAEESGLTPQPALHWAAFFGHCEHEIRPVHFGARITLSYQLRRVGARANPHAPLAEFAPWRVRASAMYRALLAALQDQSFLTNGGVLGFSCMHLYEEAELALGTVQDSVPPMHPANALGLKGADALVAVAAAMLGLRVRVVRIVVEADGDRWVVRRLPTPEQQLALPMLVESDVIYIGRDDTPEELGVDGPRITRALGTNARIEPDLDEAVWVIPRPAIGRPSLAPAGRILSSVQYSTTGWFGNEASETTFYTHAALLVDVPPYAWRVAALATATLAVAHLGRAEGLPDELARTQVPMAFVTGVKRPAVAAPDVRVEENDFEKRRRQAVEIPALLASATAPQLKHILRARGLDSSGSGVGVLRQRVQEAGVTWLDFTRAGVTLGRRAVGLPAIPVGKHLPGEPRDPAVAELAAEAAARGEPYEVDDELHLDPIIGDQLPPPRRHRDQRNAFYAAWAREYFGAVAPAAAAAPKAPRATAPPAAAAAAPKAAGRGRGRGRKV